MLSATLSRDAHGVPRVRAPDLAGAYRGMGTSHATDRGLQLTLMRILGQGRAAELLEGSDELVEVDRFFRRMGWASALEDQTARLDARTRALCQAYCDGINERFARRRPWELRLVGYRPEPWSIEHLILISRMTGYLTLAQSQAEVERLFVELVQAGVDDARLAELFGDACDLDNLDRELLGKVRLGERIVPDSLRWLCPIPRAMASNGWVVAGRRTRSGAPLLANDPHLEVNRLPNVWAEMVIEHGEHYALCMTMPGIPAPLLGRTRHLAWGATYTFMDAVDSWIEECRGGQVRRGDAWTTLTRRVERIRRKGGPDVEAVFHTGEHGVLDGDPSEDGFLLSTRWAPSESGAASLMAGAALWTAETVEEGQRHLGRIETAWNWVIADREGGIGYQMSGLMPKRRPGVSGFLPLRGWDPADDWQGFVTPRRLPRCLNPAEGFIVTANQDLNALGDADPINMPMGDYRARRIAALLDRDDLTPQDFERIHYDDLSIQADAFLAVLLPLVQDAPAARRLADWDRRYDPDSRAATLFEAFYQALFDDVFGDGGLGRAIVTHLRDETGIFIDFYRGFDRILLSEDSAWFGGRTRAEVFRSAFASISDLDPHPWGAQNHVTLTNIFFAGKLPRWLGFDRGPLPLRGGRATPHQGQVYRNGGRATSFAPSMRFIADMSTDTLRSNLAGGPSDRRFSRWYVSDVEPWLEGRYKTLSL